MPSASTVIGGAASARRRLTAAGESPARLASASCSTSGAAKIGAWTSAARLSASLGRASTSCMPGGLLDVRGDVRAATGDPDGALADWRRAVEVDPENLSPVYSSALLLERLGRLEEAVAAWQSIIAWCDSHQAPLTAEWPRQELARLRARGRDG